MKRRELLALGIIAAVGLGLRIWYVLAVAKDAPLVGDGLEIHGIAVLVAEGHGYVTPIVPPGEEAVATAHKPPLYPLTLALVSTVWGASYVAHQLATAVIGTVTVLLLALLARRLAGPRAGIVAACLGAVYPFFIVTDASLRSESMYAMLIALTLLVTYRAVERPSTGRLLQLGAVIALAALTRAEALVLLLLLAVPAVWLTAERGRAWRLAVIAAACGLVLAPWLIRCWTVFDQPVLISTNYGDLIAGANCDETYSGSLLGAWAFDCAIGAQGGNEAERADRLRERGVRYALDHLDRVPAVVAARVLRPWGLYRAREEIEMRAVGEGQNRTADWLGLAAFWMLVPLAVWGLLRLRRRRQPLFLLLVPFLLVLLVSVTGYGIFRLRMPADVAVVVLAAVGLEALLPPMARPADRFTGGEGRPGDNAAQTPKPLVSAPLEHGPA